MANPVSKISDEDILNCIQVRSVNGQKITISSLCDTLHVRRDRACAVLRRWRDMYRTENLRLKEQLADMRHIFEMNFGTRPSC